MSFATTSGIPAAAISAAILWNHTSRVGLMLLVAAVTATVLAVRIAELATKLAAERELRTRQLRTDQLTGLPNRAELMHRLEQLRTDVGLAYIDIDKFKRINATMGRQAGDQLLQHITRRLEATLLPGETAARLSGDELVVLFPVKAITPSTEHIGQRLLSVFEEPFEIDGYSAVVTASVGIAFNAEGTSPDALLQHADIALSGAKANGGSRFVVFDAGLRTDTERTSELEKSFEDAFGQGRIVPYLQPFVDLTDGRIVGAEALVRWEDETHVRSANTFMPVVHKLNMGAALDQAVLTQVTDLNLSIEAEFGQLLPISINVSPNHIDQFLDRVEPNLLSQVIVEITEEATSPTLSHLSSSIAQIKSMGSRVVLDDFGVGYSSLERLSVVPVDGLKIDRQFVAEVDTANANEAIVASTVELANRMDLLLVAEGIETEAQAQALRELGVQEGQGFLYSPAVPIETFLEMLRCDVRLGPGSAVAAGPVPADPPRTRIRLGSD